MEERSRISRRQFVHMFTLATAAAVTTAGSISAGTSLQSIRGFMWAVQEHCRYG